MGDAAPGGEAVFDPLQRGDAVRMQQLAGMFRQQLGQRGGDEADLAVAFQRGAVQFQQQVALRAFAGVLAGVVQHQQGGIRVGLQGAVEHALKRRTVAPDGGGEVQRIGDVGVVRQHLGQLGALGVEELGQPQAVALGVVGDQPGVATGAGQRGQAGTGRQVAAGGSLEGFDEADRAADTDHPEAVEQRVVQRVGTGQRAGMAERKLSADLRYAGLQGDHRDAFLQRLEGGAGEAGDVLQAFQVQANGGDARLVEQHVHQLGHAQLRLVAHRGHVGNRQRAVAHGQVVGEVAALGQHRHALLHQVPAVGHRPQRGAVQVVEQAVAVGAEQGHVASAGQQAALQGLALFAGFGEAGGVADGAAGIPGGQFGDGLNGQVAVGGDEHRVRPFGQLGDAAHAGHAFEFVVLRVDQPHRTREAALGAALECARHAAAADEGQVPGRQ